MYADEGGDDASEAEESEGPPQFEAQVLQHAEDRSLCLTLCWDKKWQVKPSARMLLYLRIARRVLISHFAYLFACDS